MFPTVTLDAKVIETVDAAFVQVPEIVCTAEYVPEESRDVVGRDELNGFHDDVDALRDDVERIAAKIARLRPGANA